MKKFPSWCCQKCGEHIGWIGRVLTALLPFWHKCREEHKDHLGT